MADVPAIRELGAAQFRAEVDEFVAVYAAAMAPPPAQLPGRRAIMLRHVTAADFRALAVTEQPGGPVIAFSYGFRGAAGQWWHDVVTAGITRSRGAAAAAAWMGHALEVAEVHVRPEFQHRGIGATMVATLTAGRGERTAVLSTADTDSTARRLYRSLGFTDLLTGYLFPGTPAPYAVMGALLPLPGRAARPSSS